MVHLELRLSPCSLDACEFVLVFGFFDLVHGGSVAEVLDLPRGNSFFLLLAFHGVLDTDVLLDT